MLDIAFVFEAIVIAFVLTFFITYKNVSMRKKMDAHLGEKCKEKMSFYFKHPFLTIIINFGVFLVATSLVKLLYHVIFKE